MPLAQIGKQIAQQVVGEKIQDVVDSFRPDAPKPPDAAKPAVPAHGESLGSIMVGQVQGMQRACKEDQELMLHCTVGADKIRVQEIFAPTWQVLVLTGIDADHNITRIISPVDSVQLVAKVVSVQPGAKPARVQLIIPKAR